MVDLGTLGGSDSIAIAINDAGQIAGWSRNASSDAADPFDGSGFLWGGRTMTALVAPDSTWSWGIDINNAGLVIGLARQTDGHNRAVVWNGTPMIELGTIGGNSNATGINDAGLVAGWFETEGGQSYAVVWTPRPG
jgi:probable HAF family extracellular repeat protein